MQANPQTGKYVLHERTPLCIYLCSDLTSG